MYRDLVAQVVASIDNEPDHLEYYNLHRHFSWSKP